jgi:transglutaminase-like putative cysteine protease
MHLSVRHRTIHRYEKQAEYAAQVLRLTPKSFEGMKVLSWKVRTVGGGRLSAFEDGFGNASHVHTMARLHDTVDVRVDGVVETSDTGGVVRGACERLPLDAWLRHTALTTPSPAIESLAAHAASTAGSGRVLHRLMELVAEHVAYRKGLTGVHTTAAAALEGGSGVCQDQAHVFVTAARALGIPARYVGGYLCTEADGDGGEFAAVEETAAGAAPEAGHAWAEAWDRMRGWSAFDPSHAAMADPRYVRTSVGLDYESASPVRGVRRDRSGLAGAETLEVDVQVARLAGQ